MGVDLFFVIEQLGIGFHWRRRSLPHLDCGLLRGASSVSASISPGVSTSISAAFAARPAMRTAVRALPHLRHVPGLAFDLGKRGPDQFTIAHLFLTSKN